MKKFVTLILSTYINAFALNIFVKGDIKQLPFERLNFVNTTNEIHTHAKSALKLTDELLHLLNCSNEKVIVSLRILRYDSKNNLPIKKEIIHLKTLKSPFTNMQMASFVQPLVRIKNETIKVQIMYFDVSTGKYRIGTDQPRKIDGILTSIELNFRGKCQPHLNYVYVDRDSEKQELPRVMLSNWYLK
jgi:hypothetical protein